MKKGKYSPNMLLMERIEQNYEDFKNEALQLDGESIFVLAPIIAAVQTAYFYMTKHNLTDNYTTEYLLKHENPLRLLADKWEDYSMSNNKNFGDMFYDFIKSCQEKYMSSEIKEMMEKYGVDTVLEVLHIYRVAAMFKTALSIFES